MRALHAKRAFRRGTRARRPSWSLMFWLAGFVTFLLWLFIAVNPFQSANPFLREATIGQSVLGDWRYGGANSLGEMKFFDAYQSVTLPRDATTFAADGEFVAIDGHTPSTITFEPAVESEMFGPTVVLAIVFFVVAVLLIVRRGAQRNRRPQWRPRWRPHGAARRRM